MGVGDILNAAGVAVCAVVGCKFIYDALKAAREKPAEPRHFYEPAEGEWDDGEWDGPGDAS